MPALIRICAAVAIALVGARPRVRGAVLALFSLALLCGAGAASLVSTSISILLFALLAGLGTFFAVLLPRVVPRIFLALLSLIALPLGLIASQGRAGIALAIALALAALFFSVRKPDWIARISASSAGALVLSEMFPDKHPLLFRLAGLAALFIAEELVRRFFIPERLAKPLRVQTHARIGAALGAVATYIVLMLPALAVPLAGAIASDRPDLPPLPFSQRREQLAALAPRGGLVLPLPSEAIFWDEPNLDRALFPLVDNLDALYLGVRTRGLVWFPRLSREGEPLEMPLVVKLLGRISLHQPIADARLVADDGALARLRAAADATVAGLHDVLPLIKAGAREADLEAALKKAMRAHGCGPESFPLIFASGPSAAEPHGAGNLGTLKEGTLLVADIGCSIDHYASDFTRTLPVSGKFDARQRLLYENVLAAQAAALAECKAGAQPSPARGEASMDKTAREVLKSRAPDHEAHMEHGLGHTVGLFVHDIYFSGPLSAGNVITIEPGTYLAGELGIRIEDTFLVKKDGCERMTNGFPAEPDAIEAALAQATH